VPIGNGPAVRLVRAARNEIQGFIVAVTSLRTAEVFLRERMLLGTVSDNEITIDPSKIEGLDIRLVEKK
jgi:sporulation protein YlmC with PRC-barrel domain